MVARFAALFSLATRAFAGPSGTGLVDGVNFVVLVDKNLVHRDLLPKGLEPMPNVTGFDADKHPVVLTFCEQIGVGKPFTNFNYREIIVNVPWVQWDDSESATRKYRGPFNFFPKLFLNVTVPVWLGRLVPGDNKEHANIFWRSSDEDGLVAVSRRSDGEAVVDASWTATSALRPAAEVEPFMKNFAASYNLPHIGKWPKDGPGPWHCFPQNYHIEKAQVHGVTGTVNIASSFAKFQPGQLTFDSIDSQEFGGFRIRTHWEFTSTLPVNCHKFDPADYPPSATEVV